jgi:hypothetical protein
MRDKMYKKYQHKLNKKIKEANKNLEKDAVFLGRFIIRQKEARWERFEDGSGGVLHTILRVADKKTEYYKDYLFDFSDSDFMDWELYMVILNGFIINDLNLWNNEKPREAKEDWTKISINEEIFKKGYNFFQRYRRD